MNPLNYLAYLPRLETSLAYKMSARLDPYIFVILSTYLAELKGGTHLAVELVLFLTHLNVHLVIVCVFQLRIDLTSVGIQITETKLKHVTKQHCRRRLRYRG